MGKSEGSGEESAVVPMVKFSRLNGGCGLSGRTLIFYFTEQLMDDGYATRSEAIKKGEELLALYSPPANYFKEIIGREYREEDLKYSKLEITKKHSHLDHTLPNVG
jgi:hypothetical protein